MAFNLENMTVDYKKLLNIVPTQRMQLAQSGAINDIIGALTPGQLVNLFPRYYRDQLPDIGQTNKYAGGLDVALSGAPLASKSAGGVTTYGTTAGKSQTIEEKAVQEAIAEAGLLGTGAVITGTDGIKDGRQARMKMTYDAFTTAGFSHKQALALTAEVGRENGFQEKYMFGTHSDPYNSATNLGMLSMQGPRLTALKDHLMAEGRFAQNGELISDQETMNSMARFYMKEMTSTENTKKTQEFLSNPDIDPERASYLLGTGYIRWRYNDPVYAKHHEYRNQFYTETEKITSQFELAANQIKDLESVIAKFEPGMLEKLDKRLQEHYKNASAQQQGMMERVIERLGVDKFNNIMQRQPVNTATLQAASVLKTSGDSILDPSLTRVSQDQDQLAGTRKLPLQQELVDTMNYAAQKISEETGRNIYFKTFSGGQAPLGSGGPRTGSTEHDLGGAADNYFIEVLPDGTERMLTMSNPDDKALMYKTAYHFARAGGRSVGLETGYMGNESIHLGISRNDEDPTHHADKQLSAIVDQGKSEFLQEAKEKGWDPKYGYKDFYLQEKQRRQEEADAKLKTEAEAIAQADPVSATQNSIETDKIVANSTPAMATGGLMDVPPGENVEIRNRDTKEILAYANDRENIRVEPGELEGSQQVPMITQENIQRLEEPMQQQQVNIPRPSVPDTTDMNFAPAMMADTYYTPSSYERATLSATLRPQRNIHFAPSKHT